MDSFPACRRDQAAYAVPPRETGGFQTHKADGQKQRDHLPAPQNASWRIPAPQMRPPVAAVYCLCCKEKRKKEKKKRIRNHFCYKTYKLVDVAALLDSCNVWFYLTELIPQHILMLRNNYGKQGIYSATVEQSKKKMKMKINSCFRVFLTVKL